MKMLLNLADSFTPKISKAERERERKREKDGKTTFIPSCAEMIPSSKDFIGYINGIAKA